MPYSLAISMAALSTPDWPPERMRLIFVNKIGYLEKMGNSQYYLLSIIILPPPNSNAFRFVSL
jgi:hypothetical protein